MTFDLDQLTPKVACPHSVDHVKPLSEVQGTHIDQAFLGTCTNGRLEDLQAAAQIYAGYVSARRVGEGQEAEYMERSIREAIQIAKATDKAIVADEEIDDQLEG